jgi:hypothetical protein
MISRNTRPATTMAMTMTMNSSTPPMLMWTPRV